MVLSLIQLVLALALSNLLSRADSPPAALMAILQVRKTKMILMMMKMTTIMIMECLFGISFEYASLRNG